MSTVEHNSSYFAAMCIFCKVQLVRAQQSHVLETNDRLLLMALLLNLLNLPIGRKEPGKASYQASYQASYHIMYVLARPAKEGQRDG